MAVKKVTLDSESLLYYQSDVDGIYRAVRYRVISEDRNRFSHWSPIYRLNYPDTTFTAGVGIDAHSFTNSNPPMVGITWTIPSPSIYSDTQTFDIFLQWKNNANDVTVPWFYAGTTNSKTFSVVAPAQTNDYEHLDIQIQLPSVSKIKNDKLAVFRLLGHNV